MYKKLSIFTLFILLSSSTFLFSQESQPLEQKRLCFSAVETPKAIVEGVKYTVLNEAFEKTIYKDQNRVFENYIGGNVYAIDLIENLPKWKVNVYKETGVTPLQYKVKSSTQTIEPLLETACLVKVELKDKKILVTNKRGEKFLIDPKDRNVKLIGERKPQIIYEQ